nr:hypothetical protein [Tanacetum cinerariifolium]
MTIPNEPIPQGTGSVGSPRRQDTILRDTPAQTRGYQDCSRLEITHLNKRVKRLEKKRKSRTLQLKRSINITTAEPVTIVSALVTTDGVYVSTAEPKNSKEKGVSSTRLTRGVIMKEASETASRLIVPPQQQLDLKDKGKCIMQEPEKPMKVKGKDQIALDEDALESIERSSKLEIILREGNRHLHVGREGVSIVKRNSYI